MTINEQLDFMNNGPLQGRSMALDDYLVRARIAVKEFEGSRNWVRRRKTNTSNTSSASDTADTPHTLPTDFRRTLPRRTLKLYNSSNPSEYYEFIEVSDDQALENRNTFGVFWINYETKQYYLGGVVPKTLTHSFKYMPKITDFVDGDSVWQFGIDMSCEEYVPYIVAARFQLGEDYDDVGARNANSNASTAEIIRRTAVKDDDSLQRSSLGV